MLTMLLAAGAFADDTSIDFGAFDVPPERIATVAKLQGATPFGNGIPLGAAPWAQALDPNDHLPFGISFADVLDGAETIATVERLAVSSAGAALGVAIDQGGVTAPIIDAAGALRLQFWLSVDLDAQSAPLFDDSGVRVGIGCRIVTTKDRVFDRTCVLTVRQL